MCVLADYLSKTSNYINLTLVIVTFLITAPTVFLHYGLACKGDSLKKAQRLVT